MNHLHSKTPTPEGRQTGCPRQAGVSFVEVLVGMFILALALLALMPLFVMASHENGAARDLTFATAAAQDKAEELKLVDLATLADGSETLSHIAVTYTRTWTVLDDTPAAGMKAVTVTVMSERFNTPGGARPAVVTFYRYE